MENNTNRITRDDTDKTTPGMANILTVRLSILIDSFWALTFLLFGQGKSGEIIFFVFRSFFQSFVFFETMHLILENLFRFLAI